MERVQLDYEWTPRLCAEEESQESESEDESNAASKGNILVDVSNFSMANLADVSGKQRIDQLQLLYHLESWDQCSDVEKEAFVHKAKDACQLVSDVIAPHDGEVLFQAVQQKKNLGATTDVGLEVPVAAYRKAPSKILKAQILSIYSNRFKVKELKAIP